MTRIVSYNILIGGYNLRGEQKRRTPQLLTILRSAQPDVVGLMEGTSAYITTHPFVIEELAEQLGMRLITIGNTQGSTYQPALMTRLPVLSITVHKREGILTRPLLEVCVEEADGQQLTVFVTHLGATFSRRFAGDSIRQREVREILRIMAPLRETGKAHVLIGDFNSLAPGDALHASSLLRYLVQLDQARQTIRSTQNDNRLDQARQILRSAPGDYNVEGQPHLDFVVPPRLRFLRPLLRIIPNSRILSSLFDLAASLYVPRRSIALLRSAGYTDCYRQVHARDNGFTCPSSAPAGRIDFIFADPCIASRLQDCDVITHADNVPGDAASDHLAVMADFTNVP